MINYVPSLIYVLAMAIGLVLLDHTVESISPMFGLLITSLFAIVFFHVFKRKKTRELYQTCWKNRGLWLLINVYVFLMWVAGYYGITWTSSTAYIFLFFISFALTHSVVAAIKEKVTWHHVIGIVIPIASIAVFAYLYGDSATMLLGILLNCFSGVIGWLYNTLSRKFSERTDLSPGNVLAVRFYLIVLVLPFFITHSMITVLTPILLLTLLAVSLFTFILPLYMNQVGLTKINPKQHSIIISTTPLATFLFQGMLLGEWSILLLVMSALAFLILIYQW